ncbi:MAG: metallophosphoesterase [Pyrinomonadaceae bacterium]
MKRIFISLIGLLLFLGSFSPITADGQAVKTVASDALELTLPKVDGSVKFLAIGDTGTGGSQQQELAQVMIEYHKIFPYEFVIMVGDNLYGSEKPADYKNKFEDVYRPLLDQGVKFYAALGNHDESNQRMYEQFNMNGSEYYRFKKGDVAFYALNSNYMDKRQLEWMNGEMAKDSTKWKIAFFHHPPYSSGGKHGSSSSLRETVEPFFMKYGVDVVFTGHEHFYERIKPQNGILYFITGAGGKLRSGDVKKNSPLTDKSFDKDLSFMLVEVSKDVMSYQVISRARKTVDSGTFPRREP